MSEQIMIFNISDTNLSENDIHILQGFFGYGLTCILIFMLIPQVYKAYKYYFYVLISPT